MSVIKPDFETACDMVRDFARKYVGTQPYARLDEQNRQLHIGLRELHQYATGTGFDKPLRFDLPNGFGWFARIGHRLSKRHRKWKRVYETYDFHPCKPSNVLRDGHMDEVIPLDDFDYGYQTIRYKSHRKGLDGKELIVTVEVPSETPYITCIRDGEQTEGDVYRNPDGSLSLIPWENNPSGKRFPLFDKDGNPAPLISPKEKETNTGRETLRQKE